MATLLLLTNDMRSSAEILPALELLPHQVKVAQAEATALLDAPAADVILLDARRDLAGARSLCRLIETTGKEAPLIVIANEGGLPALSADWGFDDVLLAVPTFETIVAIHMPRNSGWRNGLHADGGAAEGSELNPRPPDIGG